jgi:hypothetical protein
MQARRQGRRSGDCERGSSLTDELGIEQQKWQSTKVVAMQVGDQHGLDRVRVDPKPP